jgi:hypothetical protein
MVHYLERQVKKNAHPRRKERLSTPMQHQALLKALSSV